MLEARAPWWARTPFFGNLGAPIIRKEVYSLVRRNRWFWAQFIYLVVIAGGMAIIHVSTAYSGAPIEQVGASLVSGFFTLQLALVFLIFPGLAATAISSERVEKSFDLLAVSDLSPVEIVWGKLLGILGSAGYFIGSTLPILGVCIFFGGLSPLSIAIDYAFLLVVALVLSSWGILVSSLCKGNVTAIIATYALALLIGSFVVPGYAQMQDMSGARGIRELYEMIPAGERLIIALSLGSILAAFVGACLVGSVFALSPPESNRGTALRLYFTALLAGLVAWLSAIAWGGATGALGGRPSLPAEEGRIHFWILGVVMFVLLVGIAGSRVETPLAAMRGAALRPLRTHLLWPLLGGGMRGWSLAAALLALGMGGILVSHAAAIEEFATRTNGIDPTWRGSLLWNWYLWMAELFASWIFAHIGLAFLLAACGVRGALNIFLTVGVAVLLILYSASVLAQTPRNPNAEPGGAAVVERPAILTPILAFASIDNRSSRSLLPERDPATTGHWIAGVALLAAGLATLRARGLPAFRLARPGYEFLANARELPPPASAGGGGSPPRLE